MKFFIYFLSIIFLLGINLGLFGIFPIFKQIPNILLLFTLCAALGKKDFDFVFIAFISGLFLDFFSTGFFGGFTFGFLAISVITYAFTNYVLDVDFNFKTLSLTTIFAWVALNLSVGAWQFVAYKLNINPAYSPFRFELIPFSAGLLYNMALIYPVYMFYDFLKRSLDVYTIRSRGVIR